MLLLTSYILIVSFALPGCASPRSDSPYIEIVRTFGWAQRVVDGLVSRLDAEDSESIPRECLNDARAAFAAPVFEELFAKHLAKYMSLRESRVFLDFARSSTGKRYLSGTDSTNSKESFSLEERSRIDEFERSSSLKSFLRFTKEGTPALFAEFKNVGMAQGMKCAVPLPTAGSSGALQAA